MILNELVEVAAEAHGTVKTGDDPEFADCVPEYRSKLVEWTRGVAEKGINPEPSVFELKVAEIIAARREQAKSDPDRNDLVPLGQDPVPVEGDPAAGDLGRGPFAGDKSLYDADAEAEAKRINEAAPVDAPAEGEFYSDEPEDDLEDDLDDEPDDEPEEVLPPAARTSRKSRK